MENRLPGEFTTLENKSLSNEAVNKERRYKQIINILKEKKTPLTAKEIAVEMYKKNEIPSTERNYTSPRLTELCIKGEVEPVGKKKCSYSNKMVTMFGLR